jgi:alpha-acetolactate decarboxylase
MGASRPEEVLSRQSRRVKDLTSVLLSCRISGALSQAIEDRSQCTGESVEHIVRAALSDYLQVRDSQNVFYALRIDGEFSNVVTRSVRPMPEDMHLVAAAAQQSEFRLHDVTSTLIGFWSPGYLQTILVAGYHMHFLCEA